jgi:hypothetical protein
MRLFDMKSNDGLLMMIHSHGQLMLLKMVVSPTKLAVFAYANFLILH